MIDDLEQYRATVLVWAVLGGGSISLPYLEQEAFGEVPARYRLYGYVNDREFIAECDRRGIKVFGVVFEVQGWEFPVELDDSETRVLALNELRGEGPRGWIGLREFSQNRYPGMWPPFEHYFPDGLRNSDGEFVTDLFEECCSRTLDGAPCHTHWVECPDREHQCRYMDRNNPVWREYLKAIIRVQIDAGVHGVELDEAAVPMHALQYGGCFCKDCTKGFRVFLQGLPPAARPAELADLDLATFDYGAWLRARGYDFKTRRFDTPMFWEYVRYQRGAIASYFTELADYARAYAASRGRTVLVSGNFFNLWPHFQPLVDAVDIVITEQRNTSFRQPAWYRYAAGFAGDKQTLVVENPYGGVVPDLLSDLRKGRSYDRYRVCMYEGAANGINVTVPYGAWMGAQIEDAFYPPHDLAVEVQTFLAEHEHLQSRETDNEIAVIYSCGSNFESTARREVWANLLKNATDDEVEIAFWEVAESLASASIPYDVAVFPAEGLGEDRVTPAHLSPYRTVILPGCWSLTDRQARAVLSFMEHGGRAIAVGELGTTLPDDLRAELVRHPQMTCVGDFGDCDLGVPQFAASSDADIAVNVQRLPDGRSALHIVNYGYNADADSVAEALLGDATVRLPRAYTNARLHTPDQEARSLEVKVEGLVHHVELPALGGYSIVEFYD